MEAASRPRPANFRARAEDSPWLKTICSEARGVNSRTLEETVTLATEIAREGREGRKIGTLFTVGDADAVLKRSRPLVLDPLQGHADDVKRIEAPDMRETIKELAQLDGAFVVTNGGVVRSAARYLDADSKGIEMPLGLGSRHMAAASMSRNTDAVAVVVSESSVVRLFDDGELIAEIIPELWMMERYRSSIHDAEEMTENDMTILRKAD